MSKEQRRNRTQMKVWVEPDGTSKGAFEYTLAAITEFAFETNGYQGGDAGHGGYLSVSVKDRASTMMDVSVDGRQPQECTTVTLTFRGDHEIMNAATALRDLADAVEDALAASAAVHRDQERSEQLPR